MQKLIVSFLIGALVPKTNAIHPKSTLTEKLNIYKYQNNMALLEFNYDFKVDEKDEAAHEGLFPAQFANLFLHNPELEWFDFSLAQGRWNEKFMKAINNFQSTLQYHEGKDWMKEGQEDLPANNGLTIRMNDIKDDDTRFRLLSFLDSMFSVSIMEKPATDLLTIQDKILGKQIRLMANPFEQMCNENIAFLLRYLKSTKLGEGISSFIKHWGGLDGPKSKFLQTINQSQYKALKVKATKDQVSFRVSYVIHSDSYADNLLSMILAPASAKNEAQFRRCTICKSSQVFIQNSNGENNLVYDSQAENVAISDINVSSKDQEGLNVFYAPSAQSLHSSRYISDLQFGKNGLYIHTLQNKDKQERDITQIDLQDYLTKFFRPYLHTLKVYQKSSDNEEVKEIDLKDEKTPIKINWKVDKVSNTFINMTIGNGKDVLLKYNDQLLVTFKIQKQLNNFEEYPNDIARGFNLPHMPIFYNLKGEETPSMIYSDGLLISTPEPDYSMPFNVNAITHMLLGILFVNTIFIVYDDPKQKALDDAKVQPSMKDKIKKLFGCGKKEEETTANEEAK